MIGVTLLFVPEKGNPFSGSLKEDGSYTVEKLPPGSYKVAMVTLPNPAGSPPATKLSRSTLIRTSLV